MFFFIDCNPSFTIYTEISILSANRLIIPCTSDGASIRGLNNIFDLIYDYRNNKNEDSFFSFYSQCEKFGLALPKIHSVVQNKSRTHFKNASKAFQANIDKTKENLLNFYEENKDFFLKKPDDVSNIKDGNTLLAVLNYKGTLLSKMKAGNYNVYEEKTQVSRQQIETLKKDVETLLASL